MKQKGFTFIETMIALFIFVLIVGVIFAVVSALYRTQNYTQEQAQAIDEARRGVETMVREVRQARTGDDGSYPIELAGDKEFIFYSDINGDGKAERVRYFLGSVHSGSQTKECVTSAQGGSCTVSFSNFFSGNLTSARIKVSVEGDFGLTSEYADVFANGATIGRVCQTGCSSCASTWQGTTIFDVTNQAKNNSLLVLTDSSSFVDPICNWLNPNHAMKVQVQLSWDEEFPSLDHQLWKGVIEPTAPPVQYPTDQEKVFLISSYVRNSPPIFSYFDAQGNLLVTSPARLADTKLMRIFLVINVNPNRPPNDFQLDSYVNLRNLTTQ